MEKTYKQVPDFHEMMMEYFINKPLDDYVKTMETYHGEKQKYS